MNKETNASLRAVKDHLKGGGTYFNALVDAATKAVVDALSRSAVSVDIDLAKSIGYDAATQFLGHWVGGQDSEVPDVDPSNPLQKSVDGRPAKIMHPSKEDDHDTPKEVLKSKGDAPAPPPGVPAALTPEEEAAQLHATGTPENTDLLNSIKEKHELASKEGEKAEEKAKHDKKK